MVSSASWRRRRSSCIADDDLADRFFLAISSTGALGTNVESQQDPLYIRHVANQPAKRDRETLDQCRRCDDLVAPRERQILVDVDHFEVVQTLQMLLTDSADVLNRPYRPARRARDVQPEQIFPLLLGSGRALPSNRRFGHGRAPTLRRRGRRSRPTRTLSALERSPMIFFI